MLPRKSISFIPKALAALDRLTAKLQMKEVDVINRAVQLYDFVEQEKDKGSALYIREADGTFCKVHMI